MYGKLESLRGLAAVLVVLYHLPFALGENSLPVFDHGYLFVDFFFILSGFVMCHAYQTKIVAGMPFRDYLVLRLGRIYPLHFCLLAVWLPYVVLKQSLLALGTETTGGSDLSSFVSNLLLVQAWGFHDHLSWNGPSWSISAELFAYLVFYLVTMTIDRQKRWWLPAILSLGTYAWLLSLGRPNFDLTYDYGCLRCLAGFYLGVSIYRLQLDWRLSFAGQTLLECAALTAVAACLIRVGDGNLGLPITMLSFASLIAVFASEESGVVGRLLELSPARFIGRWSYSIYLVHAIVIAVSFNLLTRVMLRDQSVVSPVFALAANALILAVTIVISRFTYEWIEKPMRDLSRAWVNGSQDSRTVLPPESREIWPVANT